MFSAQKWAEMREMQRNYATDLQESTETGGRTQRIAVGLLGFALFVVIVALYGSQPASPARASARHVLKFTALHDTSEKKASSVEEREEVSEQVLEMQSKVTKIQSKLEHLQSALDSCGSAGLEELHMRAAILQLATAHAMLSAEIREHLFKRLLSPSSAASIPSALPTLSKDAVTGFNAVQMAHNAVGVATAVLPTMFAVMEVAAARGVYAVVTNGLCGLPGSKCEDGVVLAPPIHTSHNAQEAIDGAKKALEEIESAASKAEDWVQDSAHSSGNFG
ncbi:unnamed protein product [Symbiodinium necroappetens]|uniref:Uncharacterized protein n=1 Tax=Symbiodinium necroappetens TaxID=1628268 RepID=A0A812YBP5_9DINO|nr:unnamed protein product [Symbiodinium necroappetens]